jgi:hypothetical protein
MTIVANKHVARVGHEFAAAMTADTPIIEIAKMVSRLASALDKQTELTEQLAMENTILLTPENWLKHSEEGAAASAIAEGNGASEDEALLAGMKSIIACMQSSPHRQQSQPCEKRPQRRHLAAINMLRFATAHLFQVCRQAGISVWMRM